LAAARDARRFVYDPNLRPRLTTAAAAREVFAAVAPHTALVTPAAPVETAALFETEDPARAAAQCRSLGAEAAAVTCGPAGVVLDEGAGPVHLPAVPPVELVDQTGAGDVFVGTVAARLALGDALVDAARLGTAAASLSLAGPGGTGRIPTLLESQGHLAMSTVDIEPGARALS
jgi:2-dehydro-3-deoxygluconokinase